MNKYRHHHTNAKNEVLERQLYFILGVAWA